MQVEDHFHPTLQNDFDNNIEDLRFSDSGFCTLKRPSNRGLRRKMKNVPVFVSGGVGTKIRDAINGHFYEDTVGSLNESNYFKVSYLSEKLNCNNGLTTLFYQSPIDFEKHLGYEVSSKIANNWYKTQNLNYNLDASSHSSDLEVK